MKVVLPEEYMPMSELNKLHTTIKNKLNSEVMNREHMKRIVESEVKDWKFGNWFNIYKNSFYLRVLFVFITVTCSLHRRLTSDSILHNNLDFKSLLWKFRFGLQVISKKFDLLYKLVNDSLALRGLKSYNHCFLWEFLETIFYFDSHFEVNPFASFDIRRNS